MFTRFVSFCALFLTVGGDDVCGKSRLVRCAGWLCGWVEGFEGRRIGRV